MSYRSGRSDSDLEDLIHRYYKELRDGEVRIRGNGKYFDCPYCVSDRDYTMEELLRHANRIGNDSKSSSTRGKARHLGLFKYLERRKTVRSRSPKSRSINESKDGKVEAILPESLVRTVDVEKTGASAENVATSTQRTNYETFVWPWKGIVANIPVEKKDGRYVGESGSKLKMEWVKKGYNPLKVHPLWTGMGHSGFAIVDFSSDFSGFENAMAFARDFELNKHGKKDWEGKRDEKLYGWIAGREEYNLTNFIGKHLKKNGDLKTISQIQNENLRKSSQLFSKLTNQLESKDKKCEEMKKEITRTEVLFGSVMKQKDEMLANYNKELEMMQKKAMEQLESIEREHEKSKQHLEDRRKELKLQEDELKMREKLNEYEQRKLARDKEMNERAIQAQKEAQESMLKLAEEQKRQKEQYHQNIIELEKELDKKQKFELEIEQLRGDVEVRRCMLEEGDLEAKDKLTSIEEDLAKKEVEYDHWLGTYQALVIKERRTNDEIQEARKEFIDGLKGGRANIRVKRMGDLDGKPFILAAQQKFSKEEAPDKAMELCSLWEDHLRDPHWHPFKRIENDSIEVIDEDDEKLVGLKNEYGDNVYKAVTTALMELDEYNPSGRYPVNEMWNVKENRRAELKEGVEQILKTWKRLKGRKC